MNNIICGNRCWEIIFFDLTFNVAMHFKFNSIQNVTTPEYYCNNIVEVKFKIYFATKLGMHAHWCAYIGINRCGTHKTNQKTFFIKIRFEYNMLTISLLDPYYDKHQQIVRNVGFSKMFWTTMNHSWYSSYPLTSSHRKFCKHLIINVTMLFG